MFNSASVRPPCTALIVPLQGEFHMCVFSLRGQILHSWFGQYDRGHQKQTRALSLAEHSHKTLTRVFREAAEPIARPRRGRSHKINIERSTQNPTSVQILASGDVRIRLARTV